MYLVRGGQHQSRHIWLRRDKVHCGAAKGKVHVRTGPPGPPGPLTSGRWRAAGVELASLARVPGCRRAELLLAGLPHLQALEAEGCKGWRGGYSAAWGGLSRGTYCENWSSDYPQLMMARPCGCRQPGLKVDWCVGGKTRGSVLDSRAPAGPVLCQGAVSGPELPAQGQQSAFGLPQLLLRSSAGVGRR